MQTIEGIQDQHFLAKQLKGQMFTKHKIIPCKQLLELSHRRVTGFSEPRWALLLLRCYLEGEQVMQRVHAAKDFIFFFLNSHLWLHLHQSKQMHT